MVHMNLPAGMTRFVVAFGHKFGCLDIEVDALNQREAVAMAMVFLEQMVLDVKTWGLNGVTRNG